MGRGGGRSGGGSTHSSSRGVTSGRVGGASRSSGKSTYRSSTSRGSSGSSMHRGAGSFSGPSGAFGGSSARRSDYGGYGRPTPPPPPRPRPWYGGYRRRPIFGGPVIYTGGGYTGGATSYGSGLGCGGLMLRFLLILIVLAVVASLVRSFGSVSGSGGSSSSSQISQVTHTHEKLAKSECDESKKWIDDRANWLDDEPEVISAMRYFYNKTGSQPYLVIANDVDGKTDFTDDEAEDWVNDIYDEQFSDDGHTVVAFVEYSESEYAYYIVAGRSAQSVIDEEAREIIADEINYWYTDTSLDDNEYFAKVFTESADTIMFDYEETTKTSNSRTRMIVLGLTAAGAAVVIGIVVSRTSKRKKEEYEAARKLAETPVSTSAVDTSGSTGTSDSGSASDMPSVSSELEELERKYGTD